MLNAHWLRKAPALATLGRASIAGLAGLLLLAGCSGPSSQSSSVFGGLLGPPLETPAPTPVSAHAGGSQQEKSSCANTADCKMMLKTMIDSPDRGWIGQPRSPDAYADGTRLFAYRALRKQLTCNELALAVDELRGASKSLGGPVSSMTPEQLSRTRALCTQVEGELARERTGRCRT